jgi:hypothetical protein
MNSVFYAVRAEVLKENLRKSSEKERESRKGVCEEDLVQLRASRQLSERGS